MRNFGRRFEPSLVLIAGSLVLLGSILVGNSMGNRVLGAIAGRVSFSTTPVPIPTPSADDVTSRLLNRRHAVLSVATDPGFPDPRITPEPTPIATPRPAPKPTVTRTPRADAEPTADMSDTTTAPPEPAALDSRASEQTPGPEEAPNGRPVESPAARSAPAGRGLPSLPPGGGPTP